MKYFVLIIGIFVFGQTTVFSQVSNVTISGNVKDSLDNTSLPFARIRLKNIQDSSFVSGVISDEEGRFTLEEVKPGDYFIEISAFGYQAKTQSIYVGSLVEFLDVGTIFLSKVFNR